MRRVLTYPTFSFPEAYSVYCDQVKAPTGKLQPESGLKIKLNLKRLRELQLAENLGNKHVRTASPSLSASDSDNDVMEA
jgi:hypothetical protein